MGTRMRSPQRDAGAVPRPRQARLAAGRAWGQRQRAGHPGAGLAVGYWSDPEDLRANWHEDRRWTPSWTDEQREKGYAGWRKAVQRTLDWVEV